MLQGPNNFKNHILRWLLRPLSLAKFESLWIQVYSLMAVLGSWKAFSLSSLFWILIDFSQESFPLIHCYWIHFTVGCSSFYSTILRFLRYHWFPPFAVLGSRINVMSATLVAGSFLILHYFPLLRFLLQKSLDDFPVLRGGGGVLEG